MGKLYGGRAKRDTCHKRSNNGFDTTKLESVAAVRPIKDAIADLLDDYVVALSLDKVEANNLLIGHLHTYWLQEMWSLV